MTTYSIKKIVFIIFLLCSIPIFSQKEFSGFLEPSVVINYKVSDNYSHNFTLANRNFIKSDAYHYFKIRQVDVSHFSTLKIHANKTLALGLQYRFRDVFEPDKENELRLTQQYNSTKKLKSIRFGHRFSSEQRIQPSLTTFRFRYRFALDIPLQGEKLDVGEAYFISSTESLFSAAKSKSPSFDQRVTTQIGYFINEQTKVQLGLEYRAEDYNNDLNNVFFIYSSLILGL